MTFIWCLPVVTASTDEGILLNSDAENDVQGMFSLRGGSPVKTFS